jgi:hypothetical protein
MIYEVRTSPTERDDRPAKIECSVCRRKIVRYVWDDKSPGERRWAYYIVCYNQGHSKSYHLEYGCSRDCIEKVHLAHEIAQCKGLGAVQHSVEYCVC